MPQQPDDFVSAGVVVVPEVGALADGCGDGAALAAGVVVLVSVGDGEDVSVDVDVSLGLGLALGLGGAGGGGDDVPALGDADLHVGEAAGRAPVPAAD